MKKQGAKRGRPPGASQYAEEDRAALERMYELWKQGKAVSAAAKAVTKEMKVRPSPAQATERLRKKFSQFRDEKEKVTRSTRPAPESGNIPLVEMADQARQVHELLRTPDGKAKVRLRDSILQVVERTRRFHKSKI